MMKRPKVLLADDHAMVAEGLVNLLESDFDLVGTVSNGRELVASAEKLGPVLRYRSLSQQASLRLEQFTCDFCH